MFLIKDKDKAGQEVSDNGLSPDFPERAGCGRRTADRRSDDSHSGDRAAQV